MKPTDKRYLQTVDHLTAKHRELDQLRNDLCDIYEYDYDDQWDDAKVVKGQIDDLEDELGVDPLPGREYHRLNVDYDDGDGDRLGDQLFGWRA